MLLAAVRTEPAVPLMTDAQIVMGLGGYALVALSQGIARGGLLLLGLGLLRAGGWL
jgi:hypothetical protein